MDEDDDLVFQQNDGQVKNAQGNKNDATQDMFGQDDDDKTYRMDATVRADQTYRADKTYRVDKTYREDATQRADAT